MSRSFFISLFTAAGIIMLDACVDPFSTPATQANLDYLVVDGFLSGSTDTTTIRLSRTATIDTGSGIISELHATVEVEAEDGTVFSLLELKPGAYSGVNQIPTGNNVRLKIKTLGGKEFASEYVPFIATPPIDTVRWTLEDDIVDFKVSTHDAANSTHYYYWTYEGTWFYHSAYYTTVKWENGKIVQRALSDDLYHCWKTVRSTPILISTTERLTQDVVNDFILQSLPISAEQFQSKYSLLVVQNALTKDAYEYWQELKKNTENIGTIFGPQPSVTTGNISCITDPKEPVVGFFSASTAHRTRIFIEYKDLPPTNHTNGYQNCTADTLKLEQIGSFGGVDMLISEVFKGIALVGYLKSTQDCVDCRLHGGTVTRPDFWPQ